MSAAELVAIVDAQNRVVGAAPRREMREGRLPHRATYVLVYNGQGELLVQRRTVTKDLYPGFLDVVAGGVVQAGESYLEAAVRELEEELGIAGVPLVFLREFEYQDSANHVWGQVFSCTWDGPVRLQVEEVAEGFWLPLPAVWTLAAAEPFTPDGLLALRVGSDACGTPAASTQSS